MQTIKVKAGHYYLCKERRLYYVVESLNHYTIYKDMDMWQITCLSNDRDYQMDTDSLERQIFTQDLGSSIAPAMRLLYGKAFV